MRNNITYDKPFINGSGTIAVIDDCFKDSPSLLPDCPRIFIHASEENKTFDTVEEVIGKLIELEADRNTFLVGMGGGITTDITGFVASIYKRGLNFGLIPTTLLAQVDAAIGGKNGVNFDRFKNMAGTFCEAEWVYINPEFLESLPKRELLCGAAEMLKTFLIRDAKAYGEAIEYFSGPIRSVKELTPLIRRAVEIKCDIVSKDPLDRNIRHLLNLGHTFAHAIEKYDSCFLHGEAVAAGIIMAAQESVRLGLMEQDILEKIMSDFKAVGLPVETSIEMDLLQKAILQDKKREGGKITLVLPIKIGEAVLWDSSVTV